jgi:phage-related protein
MPPELLDPWKSFFAEIDAALSQEVTLHAFQKKSKKRIATPKTDVDLIKRRLASAEQDYKTRSMREGRDK